MLTDPADLADAAFEKLPDQHHRGAAHELEWPVAVSARDRSA